MPSQRIVEPSNICTDVEGKTISVNDHYNFSNAHKKSHGNLMSVCIRERRAFVYSDQCDFVHVFGRMKRNPESFNGIDCCNTGT